MLKHRQALPGALVDVLEPDPAQFQLGLARRLHGSSYFLSFAKKPSFCRASSVEVSTSWAGVIDFAFGTFNAISLSTSCMPASEGRRSSG